MSNGAEHEAQAEANARLYGLKRNRQVDHALRRRPVPPAPVRALQRLEMKRGLLSFEKHWLAPLQRARRTTGAPRFLVRVDEFPDSMAFDDPRFGLEASARFHEVMAGEGVPHLLAVVPQWTHDPRNPRGAGGRKLDDRDVELLRKMQADRVSFAQHGTTHRTLHVGPRHHSELCGLDDASLVRVLEQGHALLAEVGIVPRVLVPPHNRFDAAQWSVLESRYDVVTGGPESVPLLGFHGGPLWRGKAVYLPCYAPLYARAAVVNDAVASILRLGIGGWIPIVLHMKWELADDFAALRHLARVIAPYAADWDDFFTAVETTRPG